MREADAGRGTVLVTDAGRGSAIAILRSLGRRGYRVVAVDSDRGSPGLRSRYAHRALVVPSPERDAPGFVARLEEIVRTHAVDLVIPVTEPSVQPLAGARARFEPRVKLAIPPDEPRGIAGDKFRTLALARRLGVPVPETLRVRTADEALAVAAALGWPVVLKPESSHRLAARAAVESFEVTYAASPGDLSRKMRGFEGRCAVLLQRYCAGTGYGVELLASRGRPLAAFQHRRLREVPVTGGASSYRESVPLDPRLVGDAVRLLEALEWTGLAMVEFKVAAGAHWLMEINGRVWGSLPLAVAAGVDFPALLAALHLRGESAVPPQREGGYAVGVRCRDLYRDLLWIGSVLGKRRRHAIVPMPPRARALGALLGMLDPRRKMDVFSWRDPLPGIVELPRIAAKLTRKLSARAPHDARRTRPSERAVPAAAGDEIVT